MEINNEYECAWLIRDTSTASIEKALKTLLDDQRLYNSLRDNAVKAASIYNWNNEEKKLLNFYQNIFERA
jgi:glycosyltransferase involved in cell wall biosynthesis